MFLQRDTVIISAAIVSTTVFKSVLRDNEGWTTNKEHVASSALLSIPSTSIKIKKKL